MANIVWLTGTMARQGDGKIRIFAYFTLCGKLNSKLSILCLNKPAMVH